MSRLLCFMRKKMNISFIEDFLNRYEYTEEAKSLFLEVAKKADEDKFSSAMFSALQKKFNKTGKIRPATLTTLKIVAKKLSYSEYTLNFVFLLSLLWEAKKRYSVAGTDEKLFYDTFADLLWKNRECYECKGVYGTFVTSWFANYYFMKRIALGRFQFELSKYVFPDSFTLPSGKVLKFGDYFVNVHIPSNGIPLTDEVRKSSYMEAYEHFKGVFEGGEVIFGCESWLLYPKNREIIPEGSNILKFMDDYEIAKSITMPVFTDKWRIFGKDADKKNKDLPEKTSLQRAYKAWFMKGHKAGMGIGFFSMST